MLTYDEALDEGSVPAASAYWVTVGGNSTAAPSAVAVSGSAVTLTLAAAATSGDTVTLTYTVPSANPVQDLAGHDAAALSSQTVVNYTGRTNSPPTFNDGASTTLSLDENTGPGTEVGAAVVATDTDSADTLTYGLTGSTFFKIHPTTGQIRTTLAGTFDHEDTPSYEISVRVKDGLDQNANDEIDDTIAVTININNLDEPGLVEISGSGVPKGGDTLRASLTDPDGTTSNVEWQWSRADTDSDPFVDIAGATSDTYQLVAADVGTFLRVAAEYDDPEGDGKEAGLVLASTIVAGNNEPTFSAETATYSLDENDGGGTSLGVLEQPDDGDGDSLYYFLMGTDRSSFISQLTAGVIYLHTASGSAFDFETKTSYSVTWTVSDWKDAAGNFDSAIDDSIAVTISVTNVNEPPEITSAALSHREPSFDENGTADIATYTASDVDADSVLSWSLEGDDAGHFNINPATGALSFKNAPDYEMPDDTGGDNIYDITVKVSDNHSPQLSATLDVTVTVNDVNETSETTRAQSECPGNSGRRILLNSVEEITQEGQSQFLRVKLDPARVYLIEVHGSDSPSDIMGDDTHSENLTLEAPRVLAVWNEDRTQKLQGRGSGNQVELLWGSVPSGWH